MKIPPVSTRKASTDWDRADQEAQDFEERTRPGRREEIAAELGEGTRRIYLQVRDAAQTMLRDRVLEGDIRAVREVVEGWSAI
jgi:histidine ammonia-lyase